jgi:putative protease
LIIGPTTGVIEQTLQTLKVGDKVTSQVKKGDRFSFVIQKKIRRADKLYKLTDV